MKPLKSIDPNLLAEGLRDGDEAAFNAIYKLYFKPMYRKILFMVKDEITADEIVQELFLKIWQKHKEITQPAFFRSFMYKMASNLVYDHFRKVARDERLNKHLLLQTTDYYLHSDKLLEDKEAGIILMKAIDQLSPQRKLVFTLCKMEGKSYEETSKELGISVATVNTHMTDSFKIVKKYILKNYDIILIALFLNIALKNILVFSIPNS